MYESMLDNVADSDELHNVIMQMIGQFNASHTGISGGYTPGIHRPSASRPSFPGFDLEPDPSGRYKVSRILRKGRPTRNG